MILFCFPLPIENPFPLKLSKSEPVFFKNMALFLVGTALDSALNLERLLEKNNSVSHIVEVGGAGVSSPEKQGEIFEAALLLDPITSQKVRLKKRTELPPAMVTTVSGIFHDDQTIEAKETHLFTQETWHLFSVAEKHNLPFTSLRLATDSGEENLKERFIATLQLSRKKMQLLIESLSVQTN
ncbi:hypothetical protein KAH37_00905 [bacterium]|nr:hypothetical protein [bacterium]